MKRWWKYVLPLTSVALALYLAALGSRQMIAVEQLYPGAFYHGRPEYIPRAWQLSRVVNAPAVIVSSRLHDLHEQQGWWDERPTRFDWIEYYFAVLLLWYWIGTIADRRLWRLSLDSWSRRTEALVTVAMSVWLIAKALFGARDYYAGAVAIRVAMGMWACGFLFYFTKRLRAGSPRFRPPLAKGGEREATN